MTDASMVVVMAMFPMRLESTASACGARLLDRAWPGSQAEIIAA
jgi:hypothetical protein